MGEKDAIRCQDSNTYEDGKQSDKMSSNNNNIPTNPNTSGGDYDTDSLYGEYDFDPSLYNTDMGGGESEVGIGKQVQSSVIVLILVLLWLYTIAMFIRRSRFLRTTGQRQSTYKSALPGGNAANGPTTTGSGAASGCTPGGGIGSTSRRQSVATTATHSKRKHSQAKNLDGNSEGGRDRDLNLKFPIHSEKHNSITSLDDRILCNHVATPAKKSAMKISLPSWRVERNRDDSDSLYRQPRKMSFSDIQWDPPKNYHRKKASNDSAIAPVISISQGVSDQSPSRSQKDSQTGSKMVNQSPLKTPPKGENRLVTSHNNPKFSLTTDSSSYVIPVDADDIIDDVAMMDNYEMVEETSPGADSQITITNDIDPDIEQGHSRNSFSFI